MTIPTIERIPELDFQPTAKYMVSTFEEVLLPLIQANEIIVVGGAFFGDEGKGKTVDAIASYVDIIARLNSGENAGHTVYFNGKKFTFHLAPSGLLIPGKQNLIGSECVMDPISLYHGELKQLIENEISYMDRLTVGNTHIVTPYHKLLDFLFNPSNSSTLKGIANIHATKAMRRGLRLDDLFSPVTDQEKIIKKDIDKFYALQKHLGFPDNKILDMCYEANSDGIERIPSHLIGYLKADDKIGYLIQLYQDNVVNNPNFPKRGDVSRIIRENLKQGKKALFEASQSCPLSPAYEKFFKSATSADTTMMGVLASSGVNIQKYNPLFINIHKTPSSRVGRGANPSGYVKQTYFSEKGIKSANDLEGKCTDFDAIQRQYWGSIRKDGIFEPTTYVDADGTKYLINEAMAISSAMKDDEFGATTKKPRVLSLFDCVLNYDVMERQGPHLSISGIDRLDNYDKVGVTIAYLYHDPIGSESDVYGKKYNNGDIIKAGDELPHENVLKYCHPIIKMVDGWKGSPVSSKVWKKKDGL
jgi:adenylosuccinate synthase